MARCGCGDLCNCAEQGRYGHAVGGAGTANNPYIHRFDPRVDNILGTGLAWNETNHKLSVHISNDAGNIIRPGSDGGLYAYAEGGDNPPPSFGATVAALPATDIVGGHGGAGFYIVPDSTISGYRAAVTYSLDLTYVPVQTLRDGISVVCPDTTLQRLTNGYRQAWQPDIASKGPADLDVQTWRNIPFMASRYYWQAPPGTVGDVDVVTNAPNNAKVRLPFIAADGRHALLSPQMGYFGGGEPPQQGGTFLSDVAAEIGNRIVMVLHTESARDYDDMIRVITRFGLWSSVIVVSSDLDLLAGYTSLKIPTGIMNDPVQNPAPPTPQQVVDAGCTWALLSVRHPDSTIVPYKDAGLSVLGYYARYQSHYKRVNAIGIRGAITGDPVYYSGPKPSNNYRYRKDTADWRNITVDYGRFTDGIALSDVHPDYRGRGVQGGNYFLIGPDASWRTFAPSDPNPSDNFGSWYVQQGWCCPIVEGNEPTSSLAIIWDYAFVFTAGNMHANNMMTLAFGIENDHEFRDGVPANRGSRSQGYVFVENSAGHGVLFQIDAGQAAKQLGEGQFGAHSNGVALRRGITLETDKIQVVDQTGAVKISVPGAPTYHGGYVYLGKRDYQIDATHDGKFSLQTSYFRTYTPWPQTRSTLADLMGASDD